MALNFPNKHLNVVGHIRRFTITQKVVMVVCCWPYEILALMASGYLFKASIAVYASALWPCQFALKLSSR